MVKLIDITNQVFGKLTVISYAGDKHWNCMCLCGTMCLGDTYRLRTGRHTSCGSARCKLKFDIVGMKFGRLLVLNDFKYMKKSGKWNRSYVKVVCDCGNEKYVMTTGLLGGDIQSCGCYKIDMQEEKIRRPYRLSKGLDPDKRIISPFRIKRIKKDLLRRDNFICVLCKCKNTTKNKLQLHHIIPVTVDYTKENEITNIITVCKHCHFYKCHSGSWHKINPEIATKLTELAEAREIFP